MTDGWSAGRISSELRVSESTVRTYLARLYDKLGVRTRGEALIAAERLGLATDR
jgi:DNA-binding NarL/FixJ family response regulator